MRSNYEAVTAPGLAEQYSCTPGPWYASRKHSFVMTKNYVVIAEIRGRPEQKANALVIAEAWKMLEVLQTIIANAHVIADPAMNGTTDIYAVPLDDIEAARAVVAKAGAR